MKEASPRKLVIIGLAGSPDDRVCVRLPLNHSLLGEGGWQCRLADDGRGQRQVGSNSSNSSCSSPSGDGAHAAVPLTQRYAYLVGAVRTPQPSSRRNATRWLRMFLASTFSGSAISGGAIQRRLTPIRWAA